MGAVSGDQRGVEGGVPQGALHEARLPPSCAQLGGRGMPQGVEGPAHCGQAGPVCGSTAGALDTAPPHGGSCGRTVEVSAPGSRQEPGRVAVRFPGGAEQSQGIRRPGDVPVCGARAAVDMALEALAITVGTLQEEGVMEPQSQALDGGAGDLVVERGGGRQESPHFLHTEASGEMGGGCARAGARAWTSRAGGHAERSSAYRWSRSAWTRGRGHRRFCGAGSMRAAPVQRCGRGMCGSTALTAGLPGQRLPGSVGSCR
jgi:hypothetical protein